MKSIIYDDLTIIEESMTLLSDRGSVVEGRRWLSKAGDDVDSILLPIRSWVLAVHILSLSPSHTYLNSTTTTAIFLDEHSFFSLIMCYPQTLVLLLCFFFAVSREPILKFRHYDNSCLRRRTCRLQIHPCRLNH